MPLNDLPWRKHPPGPLQRSALQKLIQYECECGAVIQADESFVNNLMPPTCSACLHATWLVRPKSTDELVALSVSPEVDEMLSLLNAAAGDAKREAAEVLARQKVSKPENN